MISAILLIIITLFLPPVGVFLVAGCGADLLINICLTILGFFPGHIHAFYLEYVFFKRKDEAKAGIYDTRRAAGIFSERVHNGGRHGQRDLNVPPQGQAVPPQPYAAEPVPPQQQYPVQPQPNYGTAPPPAAKY